MSKRQLKKRTDRKSEQDQRAVKLVAGQIAVVVDTNGKSGGCGVGRHQQGIHGRADVRVSPGNVA
jgi:hypothetical protein